LNMIKNRLLMLNATVVKRIDITSELVQFFVKPDDFAIPDFSPGQYVALGLPGSAPRPSYYPPEKETPRPDKLIKRAYSIGSSPSQKDYLEFYIALVPDGALTSRLALIRENDRVYLSPKLVGTFTLKDVPENSNLVLVSTGTGIAPYMSMLRHESIWTPDRRICVVHGVRFAKDLAYREELRELAAQNPNFKYIATISRDDPEWTGSRGYVQTFFKDKTIDLNPKTDRVFLCGNPSMVEEMQTYLTGEGFMEHTRKQPGNLHLEKYW